MTSPNELTYFEVSGHYYDVEASDPAGSDNTPEINPIYAYVTFTARLRPGTVLYVADYGRPDTTTGTTGITLPPIQGRLLDGELQVIDRGNTPNIQLVANTPILCDSTGTPLTKLIYDVTFTAVTYAGANRSITNFAFTAPTDTTPIDLTDPNLDRLPYNPTNYT